MTGRYTKDKLIEILIDGNKNMTKYMSQVADALDKINDNNLLHKKAIDVNTKATQKMATAVTTQVNFMERQTKFIWWLLAALAFAIIALAGAEKVLKFIPFFK